jgi:hypothetical protein
VKHNLVGYCFVSAVLAVAGTVAVEFAVFVVESIAVLAGFGVVGFYHKVNYQTNYQNF